MIEIVNKVTEFMNPLQRVNDRTIYFTDIYVSIDKQSIRKIKNKKYIKRENRLVELKWQCWEVKPLASGKKFFTNDIKYKIQLKENETIDIIKIILRKELSCSVYND